MIFLLFDVEQEVDASLIHIHCSYTHMLIDLIFFSPSTFIDFLDFFHPPLHAYCIYVLVFSKKSHPPRLFQPPRLLILQLLHSHHVYSNLHGYQRDESTVHCGRSSRSNFSMNFPVAWQKKHFVTYLRIKKTKENKNIFCKKSKTKKVRHKNSNDFKIAVKRSDSIKWNFGDLPLHISIYPKFEIVKRCIHQSLILSTNVQQELLAAVTAMAVPEPYWCTIPKQPHLLKVELGSICRLFAGLQGFHLCFGKPVNHDTSMHCQKNLFSLSILSRGSRTGFCQGYSKS